MSLYKLVQHLKDYENPEGNKSPIKIKSQTARKWLYRLSFKYKNVKKDVFVNGHKWSNVREDCKRFLNKIKELKLYLVEFNETNIIKNKTYLLNCIVWDGDCRPIIIITYNKCIFMVNDDICKTWIKVRDTFLYPKSRGQGIIMSEFLLPFGRLNLFSLSEEKQ